MIKIATFVDGWLRHRLVTLDILAQVEGDEAIVFTPWEGALTFGGLVTHMMVAGRMFTSSVENGAFSRPDPSKIPHATTLAELTSMAQTSTDETKAALEGLSDEKLAAIVAAFGQSLPGHVILNIMKDHEIHHKGQLFVYARMLGAKEMPSFFRRTL